MKHYFGIMFVAVVGVGLYCAVTGNPAGIGVGLAGLTLLMFVGFFI